MKNIVNTPPSWCADAVASDRGWRHPVTGELLVSVRGGVKRLDDAEVAPLIDVVPEAVEVLPEEVVEEVIDETVGSDVVIDESPATEVVLEEETKPKAKSKNRGKDVK
jgi:hypothetical protein